MANASPGLLRRIWNAIINNPEGIGYSDSGKGSVTGNITAFESPWTRFYGRKNDWKDIDAMDGDEPIVARGLDHIARFAVQFDSGEESGFKLEGPNAELDILMPLVERAGLQEKSFDTVRSMIKFGDNFGEIVVSDNMEVSNVKMFPYAYQININKDDKGNIMRVDPEEAMRSKTPGVAAWDQLDDYGHLIAAWWPYQICRFSFGRRQGLDYTESPLACAISASKRLRAQEDGLAIARLTRSFPQRKHRIPIPIGLNDADAAKKINSYRDNIATDQTVTYDETAANFKMTRREAPTTADTDYYLARHYSTDGSRIVDGDIENVPADNPYLENLEDVYLTLRRLLCAIGVPSGYLNLRVGQKAFVDKTSDEEIAAYLRLCRHVQLSYANGLRWIFSLALLLQGRNPMKSKYVIVIPNISPSEIMTAVQIDVARSTIASVWAELGIPQEVIAKSALKLSSMDTEAWLAAGGLEKGNEALQAIATEARRQFGCQANMEGIGFPDVSTFALSP